MDWIIQSRPYHREHCRQEMTTWQFMRFGELLAGPCVEGGTLLRYEYFSLMAPGTRRAPIELAN